MEATGRGGSPAAQYERVRGAPCSRTLVGAAAPGADPGAAPCAAVATGWRGAGPRIALLVTKTTTKDAMGPSGGEGPREYWRATGGVTRTGSRPPGVDTSRVSLMPIPIGGELSQVGQSCKHIFLRLDIFVPGRFSGKSFQALRDLALRRFRAETSWKI